MLKRKIFLLSGKLQSGKNKFAEFLYDELKNNLNLSVDYSSFANPVKDGTRDDFKSIYDFINRIIDKSIQELSLSNVDNLTYHRIAENLSQLKIEEKNFYEEKTKLSRMLLQVYGTDIFRNRVDHDHWASKVLEALIARPEQVFLITDVRFPNEIGVLANQDVFDIITIRIDRPFDRTDSVHEHVSEKALDDYIGWDYIINNDSGLQDLKLKAIDIIKDRFGTWLWE